MTPIMTEPSIPKQKQNTANLYGGMFAEATSSLASKKLNCFHNYQNLITETNEKNPTPNTFGGHLMSNN